MLHAAIAALTIAIDGRVVRSYRKPYVVLGRVMAPVDPFVLDVVGSVEYSGGLMLVRRGDRFAQLPAAPLVPIGPLLRTLGVAVTYDARSHRVSITTPRMLLAVPTPFNPAVPLPSPAAVFTPMPAPTPRPTVSGSPAPRRTPLPFSEPQSRPSP
ncbi:MAG TPA: hypothetical protein VGZ02_05685 [Candidatus Baltobacteraceae bacterium]|jgi:hypothetical protein|nr:hypothetical protein [Candidatus Baltobacteraceae bacterium]